jgi:hypothetical protein
MKEVPETGMNTFVEFLFSHLRDEDEVVLAVPLYVRQAIVEV